MENVQQKLIGLDKKSDALVQEGKYLESLDAMEEALNLRRTYFGETSDEYYKTAEKLCELCNMLSMIFLQKEKFEASLEFLKKAEMLARNSLELKGVTYNNFACYYRRIGKLKVALKYLEDALGIEIKLDKTKALADTHLNICAVYSQLEKHDTAMNHIMKSIILLQDELLHYTAQRDENQNQNDAEKKKQLEDRVAVLAIAYHNLGVEYEYLKQYDEAILTYRKAVNFSNKHLGEQSQVSRNLQNVLDTALSQIDEIRVQTRVKKTTGKPTFTKSQASSNTARFKQASNIYSREGPKTQSKRFSYGGDQGSAQKNQDLGLDSYTKPIPEEQPSTYSPGKHDLHQKSSKRDSQEISDSYNGLADTSERHVKENLGRESNAIEELMKEETFNESKVDSKEHETSQN